MPIRFRCGYCNRLLGIARRKAGTETTCPHCGYTLTVPEEGSEDVPDIAGMEDLDELLNPMTAPDPRSNAPAPQQKTGTRLPEAAYPSGGSSPSRPKDPPPTSPSPHRDRPLFERDVESVVPAPSTGSDPRFGAKGKSSATSGMDAMSLTADRGQIVLSAHKATLLAIVVVILIGVSFAAGFLIAANK